VLDFLHGDTDIRPQTTLPLPHIPLARYFPLKINHPKNLPRDKATSGNPPHTFPKTPRHFSRENFSACQIPAERYCPWNISVMKACSNGIMSWCPIAINDLIKARCDKFDVKYGRPISDNYLCRLLNSRGPKC